MAQQYPKMVYKEGDATNYRIVKDAAELDQAKTEGYGPLPAVKKSVVNGQIVIEKPADKAKPEDLSKKTRAELVEIAEKKGIVVDGRWGNDKLIEAISGNSP